MSDSSQEQQEPKAPRKSAAKRSAQEEPESEAVKTDDERYVGVDPIYKQSAYEEPLEGEGAVEVEGATDEEKQAAEEAAEAEAEMLARVKTNEAGCTVETTEVQEFEEWLPESSIGVRKNLVRGLDEEQVEADKEATEGAKGEDGKIAPRSTSAQQPGVITAT